MDTNSPSSLEEIWEWCWHLPPLAHFVEIGKGLEYKSKNLLADAQILSPFLPMVLNVTKATRIYYGSLRASVFEKYAPNAKRRSGLRPEQLIAPVTSQELSPGE